MTKVIECEYSIQGDGLHVGEPSNDDRGLRHESRSGEHRHRAGRRPDGG